MNIKLQCNKTKKTWLWFDRKTHKHLTSLLNRIDYLVSIIPSLMNKPLKLLPKLQKQTKVICMACKVFPTYHCSFTSCSLCSRLAKPFPDTKLLFPSSLPWLTQKCPFPPSHSTNAWQTPTPLLQYSAQVVSPPLWVISAYALKSGKLNHSLLYASTMPCACFYQSPCNAVQHSFDSRMSPSPLSKVT